jgi:tripartite-type tricarboxylate transporter receptor subunit TctC
VPGLAGGGIDIVARVIEPVLSRNLAQTVIVDDRPGGNATVGAGVVAHAPPDGYTILTSTSGPIINALQENLTYDPARDLMPVSRIMTSPFFLAVPEGSKFHSVVDLIAAGRDPSQTIAYGHPGAGTTTHLATVYFNALAKTHFVGVPYHGAAGQATDTMSGQLQFGLFAAPDALSRRNAGLRILAVASAKRSPLAPDIPTIAESGLPGYEAELWHGIFVPAQTPKPVVERLRRALAAVSQDDSIRTRFMKLGMIPAFDTSEQFQEIIAKERAKDLALVRTLNLKAD